MMIERRSSTRFQTTRKGESSLVKYHLEEAHEGIEDTYIYEWIMKRLRDVWKWNPFSPFGSYALLYIEKSMHIEWLSSSMLYLRSYIYIYANLSDKIYFISVLGQAVG